MQNKQHRAAAMVCIEVPSVDTFVWARWRQKGQSMNVGVAVNLDSGVTI